VSCKYKQNTTRGLSVNDAMYVNNTWAQGHGNSIMYLFPLNNSDL